jgi:hypothetical protein
MQLMEMTWAPITDYIELVPSNLLMLVERTGLRRESQCWDRRRNPERTETKWRIKRPRSARTYRACAMCRLEKNTAEKPVVTLETKTWKSRVHATISHVRSRFGSSCTVVPLTLSADDSSRRCPYVTRKDSA